MVLKRSLLDLLRRVVVIGGIASVFGLASYAQSPQSNRNINPLQDIPQIMQGVYSADVMSVEIDLEGKMKFYFDFKLPYSQDDEFDYRIIYTPTLLQSDDTFGIWGEVDFRNALPEVCFANMIYDNLFDAVVDCNNGLYIGPVENAQSSPSDYTIGPDGKQKFFEFLSASDYSIGPWGI